MWSLITAVIVGFIAGLIARAIHPGDNKAGFIVTSLLGIAGSLLATYGGRLLGLYGENGRRAEAALAANKKIPKGYLGIFQCGLPLQAQFFPDFFNFLRRISAHQLGAVGKDNRWRAVQAEAFRQLQVALNRIRAAFLAGRLNAFAH